jgi:thioesterase domain-containing protein
MYGRKFPFQSMEDAASAAFKSMSETIHKQEMNCLKDMTSGLIRIVLGGWSYGGVLAVEVAKIIVRQPEAGIVVDMVILFDSPLRMKSQGGDDTPSFESDFALAHFNDCTRLLTKHHRRSLESKPLTCPIISFVPKVGGTTPINDDSALTELTSSHTKQISVQGTHWTMLQDRFLDAIMDELTTLH